MNYRTLLTLIALLSLTTAYSQTQDCSLEKAKKKMDDGRDSLNIDTILASIAIVECTQPDSKAKTQLRYRGNFKLGLTYIDQGEFMLGEQYVNSIGWKDTLIIENRLDMYRYIASIGDAYLEQQYYHKAKAYYTLALEGSNFVPDSFLLAKAYLQQGNIMRGLGNYEAAFKLYENAYQISHRLCSFSSSSANETELGKVLLNLGTVYDELKDRQRADSLYEAARVYFARHQRYDDLAKSYNNQGVLLSELVDLMAAIRAHRQALEVRKNIADDFERLSGRAASFQNLGDIYLKLGQTDSALTNYRKGLQTCQELQKRRGFHARAELASAHAYLGAYYFFEAHRNLDSAQHHLGLAHRYLIASQNPPAIEVPVAYPSIIDPTEMLDLLAIAGRLYEERYEADLNQLGPLQDMFQVGLKGIALGDSLRLDYSSWEDEAKMRLSEHMMPIYEQTLWAAYTLFSIEGDQKYLESAFTIAEKDKSLLLFEMFQEASARAVLDPKDPLVMEEEDLRRTLKGEGRMIKVGSWDKPQQSHLAYQKRYQEVLKQLAQKYPAYYREKYDTHTPTLANLQSSLPSNRSIVEYFVGDRFLFILYVDKKRTDLKCYPYDRGQLARQVAAFRDNIKDAADFSPTALALYYQLIAPIQAYLKHDQELIIVRDDLLQLLPFEAFITQDPPKGVYDYHSLKNIFLLKEYRISYDLSASLYLSWDKFKGGLKATQEFLGFAPVFNLPMKDRYSSFCRSPINDNCSCDQEYLNLASLLDSESVLALVSQFFRGAAFYRRDDANEKTFKEKAAAYRLLFLATHAKMDEQNTILSHISFAKPLECNGAEEDGKLNAYEIYELELAADLAVLTACETGTGPLRRGEGVMSLARSFHYAGCPSVVMSLWKISGTESPKLMGFFHENLKSGMPKNEALHQAKIKFMAEESYDPYFWSSLILVGDTEPIYPNYPSPWNLLWLGPMLFIGLRLLSQRLRKNHPQ